MTIEEKRERLEEFCCGQDCDDCILSKLPYCDEKNWDLFTDNEIDECYNLAFGDESEKITNFDTMTNPVQREEINHPDRYAGGKYECIKVMVDVFGADAVKHFCILNAFKYVWRFKHKNGVEDIKKAIWYLNEYVKLDEGYYDELGGDE